MPAFENKQKIYSIVMEGRCRCFCPLGQDWYDAEVEVSFIPDKTIMDYCDVDKMFEALNGQELIIEDVVSKVCQWFEQFEPHDTCVKAVVKNATHLPVTVVKYLR